MRKIYVILIGVLVFNISLSLTLREEVIVDFKNLENITNQMLEKDNSTLGMKKALVKEYNNMDLLLNKYYKKLMHYPPLLNQKNELIVAQREWIEFRNKEFKMYDSHFYNRDGSLMPIFATKLKIRFVKNRILEFIALAEYSSYN